MIEALEPLPTDQRHRFAPANLGAAIMAAMSTETWRNDLVEAFARFDGDDNGKIDRAEFSSLLDALGSKMSARDRDIGFALIDEDGDEVITLDELSSWWEVVRAEGQSDKSD